MTVLWLSAERTVCSRPGAADRGSLITGLASCDALRFDPALGSAEADLEVAGAEEEAEEEEVAAEAEAEAESAAVAAAAAAFFAFCGVG